MTDSELIKKYVDKKKWNKSFKLLKKGYPVQYIIGNVEFVNSLIYVNKHVLIPRFETEYLVDKVLKYIKKHNINNPNILDICTGSGCIAISIKKEIKCNMDALDKSKKAIKLARKNALYNNVDISFYIKYLRKFNTSIKYDIIISNPPYIKYNDSVDPLTKYEPSMALYAPNEGLYYYEYIFKHYENCLKDTYLLAFEIGKDQKEDLITIAKKIYKNNHIWVEKDLNNFDRYLFITNIE